MASAAGLRAEEVNAASGLDLPKKGIDSQDRQRSLSLAARVLLPEECKACIACMDSLSLVKVWCWVHGGSQGSS
jgi:hypothetical protein